MTDEEWRAYLRREIERLLDEASEQKLRLAGRCSMSGRKIYSSKKSPPAMPSMNMAQAGASRHTNSRATKSLFLSACNMARMAAIFSSRTGDTDFSRSISLTAFTSQASLRSAKWDGASLSVCAKRDEVCGYVVNLRGALGSAAGWQNGQKKKALSRG